VEHNTLPDKKMVPDVFYSQRGLNQDILKDLYKRDGDDFLKAIRITGM